MKRFITAIIFCSIVLLTIHAKSEVSLQTTQRYLGSVYKGNYVWGGAMNLAWTELCTSILKAPLTLGTDDATALTMAQSFNNPVFTKKDLDEKSYYVTSGYGQKTVDRINKESKKKFPKKSLPDLDMKLSPADIISYAYFLKEVQYLTVFEKKTVKFSGNNVEGFYAKNEAQRKNIGVMYYKNDDTFVISLRLKDNKDQLLIAKGYPMDSPDTVLSAISSFLSNEPTEMRKSDLFEAPKLSMSMRRDYKEIIGKQVTTKGFESYRIAQMFENIKFDMDEKGARVENEAVILMIKGIPVQEKVRRFILDAPYWIVMKRADSAQPYFILGVNNAELMKKAN